MTDTSSVPASAPASVAPDPSPASPPEGYDVGAIRARYPALTDGWAYLDGAAGTQVPRSVIEAEAAAYTAGIGNHGGAFAAS